MLITICNRIKIYGQASSGNWGNVPVTAQDYLGWTNGTLGLGFLTSAELTIKNEDAMPISFYTNSGAGAFNNNKMIINRRIINGLENAGVSIHSFMGPVILPRSILHLGEDYLGTGIGGWRTWMDIGTFSGLQSDFAFFGIMPFDGDSTYNQNDLNDAVIAWGDNIQGTDGADNLRIIFSAPMNQTTGDWSTQYSALEVARFIPVGRMGIGNFTATTWGGGSGIQPARRLEIYSEHLNTTLSTAPQLRLTYNPNSNPSQGLWTDFQSTSNGDLYITPQNNATLRNVGIQNNRPNYTLEVTGTGAFSNSASPTAGSGGFQMLSQSHPLVVKSNNINLGQGISILREGTSTTGYDDGWRLFQDRNELSHFRTIGTTASSTANNHNVTFDHLFNFQSTVPLSWFAYNTDEHTTMIKEDFNTNPAPSTTAQFPLFDWKPANTQFLVEADIVTQGSTENQTAIVGVNNNTDRSFRFNVYGIMGFSIGQRTVLNDVIFNRAGFFNARGVIDPDQTGSSNQAVFGLADFWDDNSFNYAGYFDARPYLSQGTPLANYGVYAIASGAQANYAIYGSTPVGACQNGGPCTDAAGFFNGSVYTTDAYYTASDSTLKNDITALENPDSLLENINSYSYSFDTSNGMNLPTGVQYGVLAQEVEAVLPGLVKTVTNPAQYDTLGNEITPAVTFKSVNMTGLIPLLLNGYKNQKKEMDSLKQVVSQCCAVGTLQGSGLRNINPIRNDSQGSSLTNKIIVELGNANSIILNQNDPNPFAEQTKITWNIPADNNALDAKLFFYDRNGTVLKTVKIEQPGHGELIVYASNLSSGVYTYTLMVNSKAIDTKRMVKAK